MSTCNQAAIHAGVDKLVAVEDQEAPGAFYVAHDVMRAGDSTTPERFGGCTKQPQRMADRADLQAALIHGLHCFAQKLHGRSRVGLALPRMLLVAQAIHRIAPDEDNGLVVGQVDSGDFLAYSDFLGEIVPFEGELILAPQMSDIFNLVPVSRKELVEPAKLGFVKVRFDEYT